MFFLFPESCVCNVIMGAGVPEKKLDWNLHELLANRLWFQSKVWADWSEASRLIFIAMDTESIAIIRGLSLKKKLCNRPCALYARYLFQKLNIHYSCKTSSPIFLQTIHSHASCALSSTTWRSGNSRLRHNRQEMSFISSKTTPFEHIQPPPTPRPSTSNAESAGKKSWKERRKVFSPLWTRSLIPFSIQKLRRSPFLLPRPWFRPGVGMTGRFALSLPLPWAAWARFGGGEVGPACGTNKWDVKERCLDKDEKNRVKCVHVVCARAREREIMYKCTHVFFWHLNVKLAI